MSSLTGLEELAELEGLEDLKMVEEMWGDWTTPENPCGFCVARGEVDPRR